MARLTLVLCCVLVAVAGAVDFSGDAKKLEALSEIDHVLDRELDVLGAGSLRGDHARFLHTVGGTKDVKVNPKATLAAKIAAGTVPVATKAVAEKPPSVDATLENGINYNLCFSGNFPLDPLGAINAEVDIVGYLDAKVEANAKDVTTSLELMTGVTGYISFTAAVFKFIISLTLDASLKLEFSALLGPKQVMTEVLKMIANGIIGEKGDDSPKKTNHVEFMDMVTSKTGFEILYLGWRKINQGQDTANSITNSLTRQAFAWNAALFSKITNPKLLGKPIDDAALKKLGYVQEDFVTGMAIPKLLGLKGVNDVTDCKSWEDDFRAGLKDKKRKAELMIEGRKMKARRPGMFCKLLFERVKDTKKTPDKMGEVLFPTASKMFSMANIVNDLKAAFKSTHGEADATSLFDYTQIWSSLPRIRDELIDEFNKQMKTSGTPILKGVTGSFGVTAGVALEVVPPAKKCDWAAFTLGVNAGFRFEISMQQATRKCCKYTTSAMSSVEAKFSINPTGSKTSPTFKGAVSYERDSVFTKKMGGGTLSFFFEFDRPEAFDISKIKAEVFGATKITELIGHLGTIVDTGISAYLKDKVKSTVTKLSAPKGLTEAGAGDHGGTATADTICIDASYNFADDVFSIGVTNSQTMDFNMGLGVIGIGGTFGRGKRIVGSMTPAAAQTLITSLFEKVFKGKTDFTREDGEKAEPGAMEAGACRSCVMTIEEKLNAEGFGLRPRHCSDYDTMADVSTCKVMKESLETAYIAFGSLERTGWLKKDGSSSTWQIFEPNFRSYTCDANWKNPDKFGQNPKTELSSPTAKILVKGDDSSKAQYCDNTCSAADKMDDIRQDETKMAACTASWVGFCRLMGFCPTRLMDAVDAFKKRKKPIVPKADAATHVLPQMTMYTPGQTKAKADAVKDKSKRAPGPMDIIEEGDECEEDDC